MGRLVGERLQRGREVGYRKGMGVVTGLVGGIGCPRETWEVVVGNWTIVAAVGPVVT